MPLCSTHQPLGAVFFNQGVQWAGASSIMTALNFLVTIITMRSPGMTFWRMPLLVWANFTTSLLVVVATPFIAGGMLALLVRAELAKPGMQYFDNQTFNGLFSVHASLMIFLFVIPAFAGLANFAVPLMLGAGDMAFPRLNALSFWLLPIAGIMMVS